MNRRTKKDSGIYQYLQSTGLLEKGSAEQIIAAKKLYWASVRKVWKQQHRNEYKSYTIFFSVKEHKLLARAIAKQHCSISAMIKNTCLNRLTEVPNIDLKTIGVIRVLLANFYSEIQLLNDKDEEPVSEIKIMIEKFTVLEKTILSLLKPHSRIYRDY